MQACTSGATHVSMSYDRVGLADDEHNELIGDWTADPPASGFSELALHAPASPWSGPSVTLDPGRGYLVSGSGPGDDEILTSLGFDEATLASLEPGEVYGVSPDPDATAAEPLARMTVEQFRADACQGIEE